MDFFYPNFQNDMWRLMGLIFYNDPARFILPGQKAFDKEKIITFLNDKGIALGDTARRVIRHKDNASDAFLEIVEPIDLEQILKTLPGCRILAATGGKSAEAVCALTGADLPAVGQCSALPRQMKFYRMPSTSRAYPLLLAQKAQAYRKLFEAAGIL